MSELLVLDLHRTRELADRSGMEQKVIDIAIRQVEQQRERELTTKFSSRMLKGNKDSGKPGTLRNTVLSAVASENYDRALSELNHYLEDKSEFPQLKHLAGKYIQYAVELVQAVQSKRSIPGIQNFPMAKQQDVFDRAMGHFENLKKVLKKIEQIETEMKLADVRSTVVVVKVGVYCVFAIFALGFLLELSRGVLPSTMIVIDSAFGELTNWLFDALGI